MENFKIVIDSREQLPYEFKNSIVKCLKTGDYSILGAENEFAIERKSLNDFVGSITSGRARFEKEIERARSFEYFAIVIETDTTGIWHRKLHSKINRLSIFSTIAMWSVKYNLPIFLASNREDARLFVLKACEAFIKYKNINNSVKLCKN